MFRERSITLWVMLAMLAIVWASGCDKDSTAPASNLPAEGNPNLEDATGGLTAEDEAPAFGDPVLAGSAEAEAKVDDPFANDPRITRWQHPDSGRAYGVTLLWGNLDADPSSTSGAVDTNGVVTDWSGYLQVSRGAVVVRSTIAFERDDYLVRPRIDEKRVDWVSHTGPSFDGLRIYVIQPMGGGETGEDDLLTVVMGSHRWEFRVNDLDGLEETHTVDAIGNQFSIRAVLYELSVCSRGFLGGAWLLPEKPGDMGRFQGRWVEIDGSVAGFVRGHYGISERGAKVFFGKYIDLDGNFLGFVRGTWDEMGVDVGIGQNGRMRHHGWFQGDWLDENEQAIGRLHGQWRGARGTADGFFQGSWSSRCTRP